MTFGKLKEVSFPLDSIIQLGDLELKLLGSVVRMYELKDQRCRA
jgi:hypothetical protein